MKEIDRSMTPNWATTPNPEKEKSIAGIVERELLPKFGVSPIYNEFFEYLSSQPEFTSSAHYYRYLHTFGLISQIGIELKDLKILEVGGASPISTFLSKYNNCFETESDLRIEIDSDNAFADLVLSFEVIEHIKDTPEKEFSEVVLFQESGVRAFASECHRVLKPEGILVATTPNCTSLRAIERAIDQCPPYIFRSHVREYSKEELVDIFSDFEVAFHETVFNFFFLSNKSRRAWNKIFNSHGWSIDDRGDDHFFVFKRPV